MFTLYPDKKDIKALTEEAIKRLEQMYDGKEMPPEVPVIGISGMHFSCFKLPPERALKVAFVVNNAMRYSRDLEYLVPVVGSSELKELDSMVKRSACGHYLYIADLIVPLTPEATEHVFAMAQDFGIRKNQDYCRFG